MIEVGEKTGALENMLTKVAEYYEDQVDAAVAGLTSLIEPLLIIFLLIRWLRRRERTGAA